MNQKLIIALAVLALAAPSISSAQRGGGKFKELVESAEGAECVAELESLGITRPERVQGERPSQSQREQMKNFFSNFRECMSVKGVELPERPTRHKRGYQQYSQGGASSST